MSLGDDVYAASMLNALTAANLARAEAEGERDALRAKLAETEAELQAKSDLLVSIKSLKIERGQRSRASFDGEFVEAMLISMIDWFDEAGGKNYVETECSYGGREFVFTMRAANGMTPSAKVAELQQEVDRTEAALREWCEFIGFAGRDFVKRFVEEEMRKRGLWRDPEPKEESDGRQV